MSSPHEARILLSRIRHKNASISPIICLLSTTEDRRDLPQRLRVSRLASGI